MTNVSLRGNAAQIFYAQLGLAVFLWSNFLHLIFSDVLPPESKADSAQHGCAASVLTEGLCPVGLKVVI